MSRSDNRGGGRAADDAATRSDPAADHEHDNVVVRHGDLEIEEDLEAQRRLWRVQRVLRALAVLLLLIALAGGLGGGWLAQGRASSGGHSLEYERIAYRDTPQVYRLGVAADAVRDGKLRVWVGRDTLAWMQLRDVVPPPARSVLNGDRVVFEFDVQAARGPVEILLNATPEQVGMRAARIGIEGGPAFDVPQLFLP